MRKFHGLLVVFAFLVLIPGFAFAAGSGEVSGPQSSDQKITITFPIHTGNGTNEHNTLIKYKELVEERSKGRIEINLYPGATLGTELENIEQVKMNEAQMSIFGDNLTGQLAPEFDPTCVPFVFTSIDQVYEVWNGKIGDKIKDALLSRGNMYLVGLQARGARNLTAKKPIADPSQLKGFKLRVPEISSWVTMWSSLGALATPIAWSEVYSALQTGVVDGQENPVSQIYVSKINEVNPFIMKTEHLFNVFHWVINKDFYNSLDADLQKIIMDTAVECTAWGDQQLVANDAKMIDELKKAGATFVEVDKSQFQKAAKNGLEKVKKTWDPEVAKLVDEYLATH